MRNIKLALGACKKQTGENIQGSFEKFKISLN